MIEVRSTHPFGGFRRYAFGMALEYGSIGAQYGDPRQNMSISLIIEFFTWEVSFRYGWKR